MAGIFGIQNYGGKHGLDDITKLLLKAAQQGFEHPHATHYFEYSAIGYAMPNHYSQTKWPIVSRDSNYALAVFGEIYLPNGTPLRIGNFETGFLEPFLKSKENFLRRLDGAFVFALMSDRECTLVNDPFGNFALHYIKLPDRFAFATQMDGLRSLIPNRAFDEIGFAQYLGLGMTMNGRTTFEGVSRMPGGSYLVSNRSGIRIGRYYAPGYHSEPKQTALNLESIRSGIENAVLKRTNYPNIAAALTGGFDSRTTWSIILKNGLPVTAHTHGLPNCSDLRIAGLIADSVGLTLERVPFDSDFLQSVPNYWSEIVRLTEGGISISHALSIKIWQELAYKYSILIDSYGGAFYRRQRMKVAEKLIDTQKDLIPQLLRFERSPLVASSALKPEARADIHEAASNALREYYDSIIDTPLLGDKLDRFHFEQVDAMKDSLSGNAQMNFIGIAHPFLTLPAIEAVSKVAISVRRRDGIHKYIVHKSYPKLEQLAMDNVGFIVPYRGFSQLRYAPMIAERILRKSEKWLPVQLRNISLRRPTIDAKSIMQPGLPLAKKILLSRHPNCDALIDHATLERTLKDIESGDFREAEAIIQLLTFRLMLDIFF